MHHISIKRCVFQSVYLKLKTHFTYYLQRILQVTFLYTMLHSTDRSVAFLFFNEMYRMKAWLQ